MHKNAMKCNKTQSKWCINKHGALKIIDMFETYQRVIIESRFWIIQVTRLKISNQGHEIIFHDGPKFLIKQKGEASRLGAPHAYDPMIALKISSPEKGFSKEDVHVIL
jgi:hypothetical protein